MIDQPVYRDERTVSIENTSYRWAYLFLSFGLLLCTAYRALVREEPAWDLLALVVLGGGIATFYQGRQRVLSRRWAMLSILAVAVALILGTMMVLIVG